jgi:hypothetical protein
VNNAKKPVPDVPASKRLQEAFPSAVRTVSSSDMELWIKGSALIVAPGTVEAPK